MGCCICPGLDAGKDLPLFEGIEEFVPVIGTVGEHPVYRVLLTAVLLDLVEERDEHSVVLHRFIGNLQAEGLVGLDIDHRVHLDPAAPDLPLLPHSFAPVRDLDPGAVDGDDDILGEDLGCYIEREIRALDPAKERGRVCRRETGDERRELPDKSLHLAVGHLQEDVDAGHPRNERFGILIRSTALAGIHPGKELIPPIDKVKREIEFSALDQTFMIYTPIASVRVRASPAFFLRHGRPAGAPVIFTVLVGRPELFNTAAW